eukprot:TRINITY_DN44543_c0_g1_i1.p1 TRINITY_DN44543_c0_g1~~TRINITY_DN44543_c0_g1_i1.p1  ORF type:complete len:393 (-),score=40.89 TRINITY_DN44543_c0_g1_i1:94-1272(-)
MSASAERARTTGSQCWLPCEGCESYAEAWKTLVSPENVRSTWNENNQYRRPDKVTTMTIDACLQLNGALRTLKRQGHRAVEPLPVIETPIYMQGGENTSESSVVTRSCLAAVLQQFTCAKANLGYNRTVCSLGGIILAVIGNKALAFQCLDAVYTRYRLEEYFVPQRLTRGAKPASRQDAMQVYKMLEENLPELIQPFIRDGCTELLVDMAEHFLRTLLTQAYDSKKQHFAYFVRLMHRVIYPYGEYDEEDPRRQLRALVFAIFCRHWESFARCSSAKELKDRLDELRDFVLVDMPLLKTLNMPPPLPTPEKAFWAGGINFVLSVATASVACDVLGVPEMLGIGAALASFYPCSLLTESWLHDKTKAIWEAWRLELDLESDKHCDDAKQRPE